MRLPHLSMTRTRKRLRAGQGEAGQSLVEFALVLFGIVEFGNLMRVQIELDNAVRAGAREAALLSSSGSFATTVESTVSSAAPDLSGITFSPAPSYPSSCTTTSSEVTVAATYSYSAITPVGGLMRLFHGSFTSPDTLTSTSKMQSECN